MWRLARQLTTEKNWTIRLWVDQLKSFKTIAPQIDPSLPIQTCHNIEVRRWDSTWQPIEPRSVVIAGFSCELPDKYLQQLANTTNAVWLQLEYLSAEDWVSSFHGLHSKRNDALKPVFFFPGFNEQTGGLIREQDLLAQRDQWLANQEHKPWLTSIGITVPDNTRLVSVFTYPHAPLHSLIEQLQQTDERFHLVVPSSPPVSGLLPKSTASEQITWQAIEFLPQSDYDKLLWASDLNLVRGEDSFIRAIWAGKPMLWQIYPQKDGVHHPKLDAWLKLANLPTSIGQAMHEWADGNLATDLTPYLTGHGWQAWRQASKAVCEELVKQSDLATGLDTWVRAQMRATNGL